MSDHVTLKIRRFNGEVTHEVPAERVPGVPGLVVHRKAHGLWRISHAHTGGYLLDTPNREQALQVARDLGEIGDWDRWLDPARSPDEQGLSQQALDEVRFSVAARLRGGEGGRDG